MGDLQGVEAVLTVAGLRARTGLPTDSSAASRGGFVSQNHHEHDVRDLAGFGYRQTLDRTLGGFSAFAAGFSYLSVLTGSSQLFHLGYAAGGPAFFWTWPAVLAGQFLVALCFAELSAKYPLSGGVYQWSKQVGGGAAGWMAGWVYLSCAVITLASVALALQTTLPQIAPWFQLVGRADVRLDASRNAVLIGCVLIGLSTALNAFGVRLLSRVNNVGVAVEMLAAVGLIALLAWHARRGPSVVFEAQGRGGGTALGYLAGPALAASVMATFVLYGFDTAGSLAEETDDPRRRAPRAILLAIGSVGLAGSLLVFTALRAAPDLNAPELSQGSGGLPFVVKQALGAALGTPFLIAAVFAIVVCTLTVHAAAVRLVFSMARDNHLPGSSALARVGAGTRSPALPAVLIGVAAAGLLAVNVDFPQVIETLASVAVVWANLAYLFVTVPMLAGRLRAGAAPEPDRVAGGFSLGRWGLPVNAAAVAWGLLVVVNTGWPRTEIYGDGWFGRTGALGPTAAMIVVGIAYDRLIRRRRTAGVLVEHRPKAFPFAFSTTQTADPAGLALDPAEVSDTDMLSASAIDPSTPAPRDLVAASGGSRGVLRLRLRDRRLKRR
jgi:urea carboxylase system permease